MCMITYIPRGVAIPVGGIENGADCNRDGHGWAIADKDSITVGRSMDFEVALSDFLVARADKPSSAAVFHSRFGTHGEYGLFNVHPFHVNADSVMVHNGVLPSAFWPGKKDARSDTRIFVDRIAKRIVGHKAIPSQREAKAMQGKIGLGNKLVFLGVGPSVRIVGQSQGIWSGGCWFSNSQFRPPIRYDWRPTTKWDDWPTVLRSPLFCPFCDSTRIDREANICLSCWACLDCESTFEDGCRCVPPYRMTWNDSDKESEVTL